MDKLCTLRPSSLDLTRISAPRLTEFASLNAEENNLFCDIVVLGTKSAAQLKDFLCLATGALTTKLSWRDCITLTTSLLHALRPIDWTTVGHEIDLRMWPAFYEAVVDLTVQSDGWKSNLDSPLCVQYAVNLHSARCVLGCLCLLIGKDVNDDYAVWYELWYKRFIMFRGKKLTGKVPAIHRDNAEAISNVFAECLSLRRAALSAIWSQMGTGHLGRVMKMTMSLLSFARMSGFHLILKHLLSGTPHLILNHPVLACEQNQLKEAVLLWNSACIDVRPYLCLISEEEQSDMFGGIGLQRTMYVASVLGGCNHRFSSIAKLPLPINEAELIEVLNLYSTLKDFPSSYTYFSAEGYTDPDGKERWRRRSIILIQKKIAGSE